MWQRLIDFLFPPDDFIENGTIIHSWGEVRAELRRINQPAPGLPDHVVSAVFASPMLERNTWLVTYVYRHRMLVRMQKDIPHHPHSCAVIGC